MSTTFSERYEYTQNAVIPLLAAGLSVLFIGLGGAMLLGADRAATAFEGWGYPAWVMPVAGTVEILMGALLLIPHMRAVASSFLLIVVGGSLATLLMTDQALLATVPAAVALGLMVLQVPAEIRTVRVTVGTDEERDREAA